MFIFDDEVTAEPVPENIPVTGEPEAETDAPAEESTPIEEVEASDEGDEESLA